MMSAKQFVLTILLVTLLAGCDPFEDAATYEQRTTEFVEALVDEEYDKCMDLFAMEHEMAKGTDVDAIRAGLVSFREIIVSNWGSALEFSFLKWEKKFSTLEAENTPPNTTRVLVEFHNQKDFGVLQVLFDDTSEKIIHIRTLDVKAPIPSMVLFWLFGLIAICIPIFNIYVMVQIKRSDLTRKWLKYIAVAVLNTPAITYAAVNGLSVELLSFQVLLGIGFSTMGFLYSYWTFGIPLGGLYWFLKIRQLKKAQTQLATATDQVLPSH